ncbi:MAG: sulfotransferase [Balneola sp.]
MAEIFSGPLFIVGMPRSGTKLLRGILNNHSKISIPDFETHFIPSFLNDSSLNGDIDRMKKKIVKTNFYQNVKQQHGEISEISFANSDINKSRFLEYLLKYYSGKYNNTNIEDGQFIWGDKTPLNVKHLADLINYFPNCKIIHLVRDPRDICLSYKKTWGRRIRYTAEKWRRVIESSYSYNFDASKYIEIKFEDLTTSPDKVAKNVCTFCGIDYEQNMEILRNPVEKFGDVKAKKIIPNSSKYLNEFNKGQLRVIESITKKYLLLKGYELTEQSNLYKPLSKNLYLIYKIEDYLRFLIHLFFKEGGIKKVYHTIKSKFNTIKGSKSLNGN